MRRSPVHSVQEPWSPPNEPFHKEDSRQTWASKVTEKEETPLPTIDAYSLKYFAAALHATILESSIRKLRCLDDLNTELRIINTMVDMERLRALKHGVKEPEVTDELQGVDPKNLKKDQYKLVKLANDRKMVCDTLLALYFHLGLKWNFRPLHDHVEKVRARNSYREQLHTDNDKFKLAGKELAKQIRHQRNNFKSTYYDTDNMVEDLKSQVEVLVLHEESRSRYALNWQNARHEQHLETIQRMESEPVKSLQYYKSKMDDEHRVHSEIEILGILLIDEKAVEVERWMNKYDTDMEAVDLKIQIQKNEYNVAYEQRLELEETIKTHTELVKNWVQFKEDREAKRLYEEKMNRAAIVLQAWWRGLLVRKALGPYKVKRRPAAKKEKKK